MADNSGSSANPNRRQPQQGIRTLRDLSDNANGSGGSRGPARGRPADRDSDDSDDQDLFAGGEKSALAVQGNPRDQVDNLLNRARRNAPRPGGDDPAPSRSHFRGDGVTLGGDDTPSQVIRDPTADQPRAPERVVRTLHIWNNGFSVDDGELLLFNDPANRHTLDLINSGRAPLDVLNVQADQEVDLQIKQHSNEPYKAPKKSYKPFGGSGQRLGSPAAAADTNTTSSSAAPAAPAPAPAAATPDASDSITIDPAQPTITLQIRLGDGTRLRSRFNPSHTVGDVYDFVNAASTASRERGYTLMTTFPSTDLADRNVTLGDNAELKQGGNVIQKWT